MPPQQLPAPASRRLENAEPRFRFRQQIHRESSLRRGVSPLFNLSAVLLRSSIDGSSRSRSVEISSRVLVNPQLAVFNRTFVFNRTSWSRSVKRSSAELVNPLFDSVCVGRSLAIAIQRLSRVLISFFADFNRSRSVKLLSAMLINPLFAGSRSRSAEITMSAELIMNEFELNDNDVVVVVSLPQRRTRKKKQLIASIPDFAPEKSQGERRVWNLNKRVGELRFEIGGVMATRSSSVNTNSHSVFLKPEPFLSLYFFPCILISLSLSMMYYERFIQVHREKDADITVAEMPMDEKHVIAFGLMKICEEGRNIELAEKPKGEQLKAMKVDTTILGLDDEAQKSLHDAFYVVRCLVNKRFLNAGGEMLPQDSPQLYWLWITFFAVDVFFVVIRVVVACIIGIAVCNYLPCIITILYAVADQEGATGRIQANMSPEVPLNENLADFLSQAASLMPAFMDSALDTFPVGHSVLTGAADPGEVLALRVKDTLNAVKEGIDCWRWMQQISESVATVLGMQHAKTKSSFDLIGLITEKESSNCVSLSLPF